MAQFIEVTQEGVKHTISVNAIAFVTSEEGKTFIYLLVQNARNYPFFIIADENYEAVIQRIKGAQ